MPRRLLSLATAAVTLGALVATAPTASASVSPRAAFDALTIEGAAGSYLLPSGNKSFVNAALNVTADDDTVTFASGDGQWAATLQAPTDAALAVGTYSVARSAGTGVAGLDISGRAAAATSSRGRSWSTSSPATAAPTTSPPSRATFSVSCETTMPINVGELRFDSTIDYERFGAVALGKDSTVRTLTVTAAAETTFGTASIDGTDPATFRIAQDGCSGTTVPAAGTCTVTVLAHPLEAGGPRRLAGPAERLRRPGRQPHRERRRDPRGHLHGADAAARARHPQGDRCHHDLADR